MQLGLFDKPQKPEFGTEPHKLVRNQAPATSIDAACKTDTQANERLVYDVIKGFGESGCISDEIRAELSWLPYSTVTARYKALKDKNLIVETGNKRPGDSGRGQMILRVVKI